MTRERREKSFKIDYFNTFSRSSMPLIIMVSDPLNVILFIVIQYVRLLKKINQIKGLFLSITPKLFYMLIQLFDISFTSYVKIK